jgi:excisionase family DNA binding protein
VYPPVLGFEGYILSYATRRRSNGNNEEVTIETEQSPEWITVSEMRRILSLSKGKAYEILATEEGIESVQLGRAVRVNKRSLEAWVRQQTYPRWRERSSGTAQE